MVKISGCLRTFSYKQVTCTKTAATPWLSNLFFMASSFFNKSSRIENLMMALEENDDERPPGMSLSWLYRGCKKSTPKSLQKQANNSISCTAGAPAELFGGIKQRCLTKATMPSKFISGGQTNERISKADGRDSMPVREGYWGSTALIRWFRPPFWSAIIKNRVFRKKVELGHEVLG